jgi:hypothetical protein
MTRKLLTRIYDNQKAGLGLSKVAQPVIPATQEAEIKIEVQGQSEQKSSKIPS